MVDVGVAHHDRIDPARIEGHIAVECGGFGAAPLKEACVEENPRPRGFEEMHRAGDLARRAPEGEFGCCHA